MNTAKLSVRWDDAILAAVTLLAAVGPGYARGTAAGTVLTTQAEVTYTDTVPCTVTADPATVTVGKTCSLGLGLAKSADTVAAPHAYACTLYNNSNYTSDFQVSLTPSNLSATIIRDTNADGVLQLTETETVQTLSGIAPDASVPCLLVVSPNANSGAKAGSVVVGFKPSGSPNGIAATFSATFSAKLSPSFQFHADSPLTSSPIVRNGLALVGSEAGVLYAVQTAGAGAGTALWRYPAATTLGAPIRSRVASDGANFYFTANDGNAYCVRANGALKWRTQVAASGTPLEAMPILGDSIVSLACGDGRVRVLDRNTGALIIASPLIGKGKLTTPAAPRRGDMWLGGSDGTLYNLNDAQGFTVLSAHTISDSPVDATPFVDASSGLLLSVSAEGSVYAMQMHSDKVLWGPVDLGSPVKASPWVDSGAGVAYFAGLDNRLHALHVQDGTTVPGYPVKFLDGGSIVGAPVVIPVDGRPTLIAGTTGGRLYAVNAADPSMLAQFDTSDPSARFVGTPAVSGSTLDDVIVATATDGNLYGFTVRNAVGA